jgi:hypothetical protein
MGYRRRGCDPHYRDYHAWDNRETVYYRQWAVEAHRDPRRNYGKLRREEQREYWDWRHKSDRH